MGNEWKLIAAIFCFLLVVFGYCFVKKNQQIEGLFFESPTTGVMNIDYKDNAAGDYPVIIKAVGVGSLVELQNTAITLQIGEEVLKDKVLYSGENRYRINIPRLFMPDRDSASYTMVAYLELNGKVYSATATLIRKEPGLPQKVKAKLEEMGIPTNDKVLLQAGLVVVGLICLYLSYSAKAHANVQIVSLLCVFVPALIVQLTTTQLGVVVLLATLALIGLLALVHRGYGGAWRGANGGGMFGPNGGYRELQRGDQMRGRGELETTYVPVSLPGGKTALVREEEILQLGGGR